MQLYEYTMGIIYSFNIKSIYLPNNVNYKLSKKAKNTVRFSDGIVLNPCALKQFHAHYKI